MLKYEDPVKFEFDDADQLEAFFQEHKEYLKDYSLLYGMSEDWTKWELEIRYVSYTQ